MKDRSPEQCSETGASYLNEKFPDLKRPSAPRESPMGRFGDWLARSTPFPWLIERQNEILHDKLLLKELGLFLQLRSITSEDKKRLVGELRNDIEMVIDAEKIHHQWAHYSGLVFNVLIFLIYWVMVYTLSAIGNAPLYVYALHSSSRAIELLLLFGLPFFVLGLFTPRFGNATLFTTLILWPSFVYIQFYMWTFEIVHPLALGNLIGLRVPESPDLRACDQVTAIFIGVFLFLILVRLFFTWFTNRTRDRRKQLMSPHGTISLLLLSALAKLEGNHPRNENLGTWPRYALRKSIAADLGQAAKMTEQWLLPPDSDVQWMQDPEIISESARIAWGFRILIKKVIFSAGSNSADVIDPLSKALVNLIAGNWNALPRAEPPSLIKMSFSERVARLARPLFGLVFLAVAIWGMNNVSVQANDPLIPFITSLRLALLVSGVLVMLTFVDEILGSEKRSLIGGLRDQVFRAVGKF